MHVHILQHVPFEGPGSIKAWLSGRGANVTYTRFFESTHLPALADIDFIIALGGPMSVNDEEQLPWLREEKQFVADAITSDKAVLGICLGSLLIASALGSRVYPGQEKEIGWFPVFTEPAVPGTFGFPASIKVFHWHLTRSFLLPTHSGGDQKRAGYRIPEGTPRHKLLIVLDGPAAPRSRLVRALVGTTQGTIQLERLPAYAPELNPVEYIWAHLKKHALGNFGAHDLDHLSDTVRNKLKPMQRRPTLDAALWKQTELAL